MLKNKKILLFFSYNFSGYWSIGFWCTIIYVFMLILTATAPKQGYLMYFAAFGSLIPALIAYITFLFAFWPVWGWLTIPILTIPAFVAVNVLNGLFTYRFWGMG